VAAGGDGTLGEVANGLAGTETVMAPLPVGTANSFGKELGMPRPGLFNRRNILRANDLLALGSVKRVDLGRSKTGDGKEHYWLLWSGTGADGYLVDQLEPRHPWLKRFGRAGYVTESLWVAPRLPPMWAKVDVDGRHFSDKYLLIVISNCRRYAGGEVVLSPGAKMDDGSFEVWLFRGEGMLEAIRHFGMTKLGRHLKDGDIIMVSGRRVSIETDPVMPCQCDGERVGVSPMQCEIVPGALRLLVPRTAPADLFEQPGAEIDELFGVNQ
jgi:YegS/Rv2252/BmrU family lipid kinase